MNKPSRSCHLNWRPLVMILASIKLKWALTLGTFLQKRKLHSLILYIPFSKWTKGINLLGLNHFSELNPILDKPSPDGCGSLRWWGLKHLNEKGPFAKIGGLPDLLLRWVASFSNQDSFWIPSIYLSSDRQNWMWEAPSSIYFIPEITSQFHHGQNIGF